MIPGLGRSPGEGNAAPLQHSCLNILRTGQPGRLQFTESQELDLTLATNQRRQYNDKSMPGMSSFRLSILCYLHCKAERKKNHLENAMEKKSFIQLFLPKCNCLSQKWRHYLFVPPSILPILCM